MMFAPQTYVCDSCGKMQPEKRLMIEIEVGKISHNGQIIPSSNKTIHLCSVNDKCITNWAKNINQKEIR